MREFLRQYRKRHIYLAAALGLLGVYFLCRGNRQWMNALNDHVTAPLRGFLGRLCYLTDVSVMEVLCVLGVLAALVYVLACLYGIVKARGRRWRRAYGAVLGAVCILVTLYDGFCLMWGVNFWIDSFQDRSGIYAQPVAREDLEAVAAYFARQASLWSARVERDENGVFAVPRQEILDAAPRVYDGIEEQYPFLTYPDPGVKAMAFSRLMSRMNFTGVYCSFTGESNVNVDSPACLLPSTIAHELAHQRGIASEQECNFLAVLSATSSGMAPYIYSGWLMGYIYLGNALYRADPQAYWQVYETLSRGVQADLADNNAYWDQFEDTVVQKVSDSVYDGMLKAYGDEDGIASYGTVVDLLVTYYRDII